jgi:hypothetical protein
MLIKILSIGLPSLLLLIAVYLLVEHIRVSRPIIRKVKDFK